MKHYSHGELNFFESLKSVPRGAKKVVPVEGKYIVANSETTGNHHCVEAKEGVELYEKNGIMYLKNKVPTKIFCILKERHDDIDLSPGLWEIEPSKEYDYFSDELRNVAD